MHLAFHLRGATLGGTSAGAAALSRQMLAIGEATVRPETDVVSVDIGLGFVSRAIVDQHFSERGRLARLLLAMALRPDLLGMELHLLPSGSRYTLDSSPGARRMIPALKDAIALLVEPGPIRG